MHYIFYSCALRKTTEIAAARGHCPTRHDHQRVHWEPQLRDSSDTVFCMAASGAISWSNHGNATQPKVSHANHQLPCFNKSSGEDSKIKREICIKFQLSKSLRYLLVMATETVSLLVLSRHGSTQELAGLGLGPLGAETGFHEETVQRSARMLFQQNGLP